MSGMQLGRGVVLGAFAIASVLLLAKWKRRRRFLHPNFSLNAGILGFDLDHTLCRYRLPEVSQLIYESLRAYMLEQEPALAEFVTLRFNMGWLKKGLILDWETGDVLMISTSGAITACRHGTLQQLSSKEIEHRYGTFYSHTEALRVGKRAVGCLVLSTYFDCPAAFLFAQIVDWCDVTGTKFTSMRQKLFDAFNNEFNPEAFSLKRGTFFPTITSNPAKFLYPRPEVRRWLERKREEHHTLFLLTNSHADYTNFLCTFIFGTDWRQLFDLVVVHGLKPSFFQLKRPLFCLDEEQRFEGRIMDDPLHCDRHTVYAQGNADLLAPSLAAHQNEMGSRDVRVTYFGDHLIGDVAAVHNMTSSVHWHAVAIVEEIMGEDNSEWPSFFGSRGSPSLYCGIMLEHADLVIDDVLVCADIENDRDLAASYTPQQLLCSWVWPES